MGKSEVRGTNYIIVAAPQGKENGFLNKEGNAEVGRKLLYSRCYMDLELIGFVDTLWEVRIKGNTRSSPYFALCN